MHLLKRLSFLDQQVLHMWLTVKLSLADVDAATEMGLVGNARFTQKAKQAYFHLWTWSADRFDGEAGRLQDAYYKRFGASRLKKRIERCNRLIYRFLNGRPSTNARLSATDL